MQTKITLNLILWCSEEPPIYLLGFRKRQYQPSCATGIGGENCYLQCLVGRLTSSRWGAIKWQVAGERQATASTKIFSERNTTIIFNLLIFNLSFLTVLAAKNHKFPVTIFASKRKRNAAAGGAALKKKWHSSLASDNQQWSPLCTDQNNALPSTTKQNL